MIYGNGDNAWWKMAEQWPKSRQMAGNLINFYYTVELCTFLKFYLVKHKLLPEFTNDAPCHRWIKYYHSWFSSLSRVSRTDVREKLFNKLTCWLLNLNPITGFRVSEPLCFWLLVKNNFWNFLHCWLRLDNFQRIRSKCCPMECLSSFNNFVSASLIKSTTLLQNQRPPSTRSRN